jgi:iron(III) transport system substrate-binding protein
MTTPADAQGMMDKAKKMMSDVKSSMGMAPLPKTTQKMLKELKMDASALSGLDKELAVPQAWIDGAKKEGQVKIWTTYRRKPWGKMERIFTERYPFIKVNHDRVSNTARRVIRPLTAFKTGRVLVDVITGLSGEAHLFQQAKAFVDLRDLPSYDNLPKHLQHPDGITSVGRIRYYCFAYNRNKVKESELPKTWDDLVNSKRFAGKKIGLANRPNNWLLPLWKYKGGDWGRQFTDKLFALKPQLRKEGQGAVLALVVAGEMEIGIPAAMNRVAEYRIKNDKTPVGHHCPTPVVFTISETGIMAGNSHMNAAKLYVNWYLSKEGQLAQFWANESVPSHKGMRDKRFVYWPENVTGKEMAQFKYDNPEAGKEVLKYWDARWIKGGGYVPPKASVVNVKLDAVKRGGRVIEFKVDGKADKARMSRSRSKVTIGGKKAKRGDLKVGMSCKILYPKGGGEAKTVDCK